MNRINAAVRRNGFFRSVSKLCRAYQRWYGNHNYNKSWNGERWLLQQLSSWDVRTVIDGGANVGDWTELATSLLPEANIYAFEIVPDTFEHLKRRFLGHPRVHCVARGLSDRLGSLSIHFNPAASSHATFASPPPHPGMDHTIECQVTSGDDFLRQSEIATVDLLKLDIEGAELLALRGFEAALAGRRVRLVQFEYGQVNIITKCLLRDFYEFFTARGYVIGKLFPDFVDFREYSFRDEDFLGPNYVACRSDDPALPALRNN